MPTSGERSQLLGASKHQEADRLTGRTGEATHRDSTLRGPTRGNSVVKGENGTIDQSVSSRMSDTIHVRNNSLGLPLRSDYFENTRFRAANETAIPNKRLHSSAMNILSYSADVHNRPDRILPSLKLSRFKPSSISYPSSPEEATIEAQSSPLPIIEFREGDPPQGLDIALRTLTGLIQKNLGGFKENEILKTRWDKSQTVYKDHRKEVVWRSDIWPLGEELDVSRFYYGSDKQFLVAWVPDPAWPGSYLAHMFGRASSSGNHEIDRHGRLYVCISRRRTWVPSGRHTVAEVYKYVHDPDTSQADMPEGTRKAITASDESDRSYQPSERPGGDNNRKSEISNSTESDNACTAQAHEHTTKKRKLSDNQRGDRFRSESHEASLVDTDVRPPSLHSATTSVLAGSEARLVPEYRSRQSTTVHTRQDIYPNVHLWFVDTEGITRGKVPFKECKTAKDLFEVACVRKIAFVRPPEMCTRLLRVEFNGRYGILRIYNEDDFEEFVSLPLRGFPRDDEVDIVVTVEA